MFEHYQLQSLNDFFSDMNSRQSRGVFFYRINGYSAEIREFLVRYYETARKNGVVIEGKIPNPDEKNLSYYNEIMGMEYRLHPDFFALSLKRWLPRMNEYQRQQLSGALYDSLESMARAGKTENMQKNAYIKFMCWLYYKFERIVNQLGQNTVPKLLYEGEISKYELMLLSVLSRSGCDVVLLQYHGDEAYRKQDPDSSLSVAWSMDGLQKFPEDFSIKRLREELREQQDRTRLYGEKPSLTNCTNAWIEGKGLDDFLVEPAQRGTDPNLFYNCFCRINGAQDRQSYENDLYRFRMELVQEDRKCVVINGVIPVPSPEEIASIKRKNYARIDQMILDLGANIRHPANLELQKLMNKAFVDVLLAESGGTNLNKLTVRAVYLLCWLKRYQSKLFSGWKPPAIPCVIEMGGCRTEDEALFLRFLARLPCDVLILCPNLNTKCILADPLLYEVTYPESFSLNRFPEEQSQVRIGTVAYQAERELDTLMYENSGLYRNRQYAKADTVTLRTMAEEIPILWDQELKYRPCFHTADGTVTVPVIFAKISGVRDGDTAAYWQWLRGLITQETYLVSKAPFMKPTAQNPMKAYAVEFYKNGKLQRSRIKNHRDYPYGYLRDEVQEYMLDKLQQLIDRKVIRGTGENGTEYTIVSTVLNLPKEMIRLIQSFDFTKKNPKLIYINTTEEVISLEDAILTAYLNLIGFDILFFVPTGYQNVEKYWNERLVEEHQTGEYLYDLQVPRLERPVQGGSRRNWLDRWLKRGD